MTTTHQQLEGRVFTRLKQYEALPLALKDEIHALEQYLTEHQAEVFQKHHPNLVKSAVGVKYKELLEKIDEYLASHKTHSTEAQAPNRPLGSGTGGMLHGQHVSNDPTSAGTAHHATEEAKDKTHGHHGHHERTHAHGYSKDQDYTGTGPSSIRDEPTLKDKAVHAKEKAKEKIMGHNYDQHEYPPHDVSGTQEFHHGTTHAPGHRADPSHAGTRAGGMSAEGTMADKENKTTRHSDNYASHSVTHGDGHIHGTRGVAGTPAGGPLPTSTNHHVGATEEVKAKLTGHSGNLHHTANAQKLVEGLVLKGFITPYKEDNSQPNINMRETFDFKDSDLFVPVVASVAGLAENSITVWDVTRTGAIYAGMVKRKTNIIEKIKHGKDVYVVVNERNKTLTIFDSDLSREAIAQVKASGTQVAMDTTYFDHGIRVWNEAVSELFDQETKPKCEVFVEALRAIGMRCDAGLVSHGKHMNPMHEVKDGKGMPNIHDKMKHDTKEVHNHKGMPNVHDTMKNQHRDAAPTDQLGHVQHTAAYDHNARHSDGQHMGSGAVDSQGMHKSNTGYVGVTGNPSKPTPSYGGGQTNPLHSSVGQQHDHDPTSAHSYDETNKPTAGYAGGNTRERMSAP